MSKASYNMEQTKLNPYVPFSVALIDKKRETHNTYTLTFKSPDNSFHFIPGQFNMMYIPGIGEAPISISGNPVSNYEIVHTIREVGAVSSKIIQTSIGHQLGLRGPFGKGWPVESAKDKDVILVTGGIGLAPLRPLIYQLLENRDAYNKITLLYGARTPQDILFQDELKKWLARFDIQVEISVDRDEANWKGHVGVITRFISTSDFDPGNCVSMICGPEVMIRYSVRELATLGVKDDNIYVSMERNMKCGVGHCGHCQYGGGFVCKDGPVFSFADIKDLFSVKEI
ncbi:MAG: FAD/NAD(P)-binding protein [Leptospirales bacterium]